ncbi:hypothetical protein D3C81_1235430 [compost metagenome]
MTGILASVAILANAAARRRSSGIGISPTVWNRPLWWSISSMATLDGSMTGLWLLKLAGVLITFSFEKRRFGRQQISQCQPMTLRK